MTIEFVPKMTIVVRWTCDDCGQVGIYATESEQRGAQVQHNSPRTTLKVRGKNASPCEFKQMENKLADYEKEDARGEARPDEGTPPGDGPDGPDVDGGAGVPATPSPDTSDRGGVFAAVFTPGSDHESRES